jgi:lysozyme
MNKEALEIAASLCRTFEGLILKPYMCPAGVPTIGYGSTRYANGKLVTLTDPKITKEEANHLLLVTLKRDYYSGVVKLSPNLLNYPSKLGAIVDFAYNCGVPRYRSSTLRKCINREDWAGAKIQLMKWTRGGGRVLPGLVRRRQAEALLLDN